jgi:phage terminase large subunit
VVYGGAGAGKSYFAAMKMLLRLIGEPNHRILICRKVARTIRNSQYILFRDIIRNLKMSHEFSFCDNRLEITFKPNGNKIISTGIDDPEKLKSLTMPTSIWIEEATELTPEDFRQLDLRLRAVHHTYMQIILTFNPVTKAHWLYETFVARTKENATIMRSVYKDNHFIDAHYKAVINGFKEEDEHYYRVYGLGEWGDFAQGLVYNYIIVDEVPEPEQVIYGMDFGYNNPTVLVKLSVRERDVYVEELIYKSGITTADVVKMLPAYIKRRTNEIYADAAEPDRIEEIYRGGFNVKPACKDVSDGIDHVKRFRLHVLRGSTNLIKELDTYRWKEDRMGHTLDEPLKQNDHACDAIRYAIHTHFGGKRLKIWGFA